MRTRNPLQELVWRFRDSTSLHRARLHLKDWGGPLVALAVVLVFFVGARANNQAKHGGTDHAGVVAPAPVSTVTVQQLLERPKARPKPKAAPRPRPTAAPRPQNVRTKRHPQARRHHPRKKPTKVAVRRVPPRVIVAPPRATPPP